VLETANPGLYASLVRQREAGAMTMSYAKLAGGAIGRRTANLAQDCRHTIPRLA
jgi:hypothetical protein